LWLKIYYGRILPSGYTQKSQITASKMGKDLRCHTFATSS
jgi:hypothetical protein